MSQSSPEVPGRVAVFTTPWFEVVAKTVTDFEESYYSIKMSDYVTILAVTEAGEVPLIRQYRPVVEDFTLELPSGHVERDEAPLDAALRALREETGFVARRAELLGVLVPDTGRLENRLWYYFADDVVSDQPVHGLSADGLEVV